MRWICNHINKDKILRTTTILQSTSMLFRVYKSLDCIFFLNFLVMLILQDATAIKGKIYFFFCLRCKNVDLHGMAASMVQVADY